MKTRLTALKARLASKLVFLTALVLVAFALTVASPSPRVVKACSGDDCGCNFVFQLCMEGCQVGDPCVAECRREAKRCAIECCSIGTP